MVILSEVKQTEKDKYHISFMCEIYSVNELIHKTERESQIQKTNYGYHRGKWGGRDKLGD